MPSDLNKPTGLGYQSSMQRCCTLCYHLESTHYGHRCHASLSRRGGFDSCACLGFSARELDEKEKEIMAEQVEKELEYVGEALYLELTKEAARE